MRSPDPITSSQKAKLTRLARKLVEWAGHSGREFPWRHVGATEYEKIAVEVLLQRTTATAVAGFYGPFFKRYPTWQALASAAPDDLEKYLKPLGLWRRRAVSLLGLATYAAASDGKFPLHPAGHKDIPAVGQYVSNAIMVTQHGKRAPLLDVNMARVIERYIRPRKLADIRYDPWLQTAAHWLVRKGNAEQVNWAVLDFAALVCRARSPACLDCPVNSSCAYFATMKA